MALFPRIAIRLESVRPAARSCPLPTVCPTRSVPQPVQRHMSPTLSSSSTAPSVNDRPLEPAYYPGIEEEMDVSYDAYHKAFEDSKPEVLQVPGLQEFAAAIWQRRKDIPSSTFKDPLLNIFNEFDSENKGFLSADQIAKALKSYGVEVTVVQVQWYITRFEEYQQRKMSTISKEEFPMFIFSMAIGDLHAHPEAVKDTSQDSCELP